MRIGQVVRAMASAPEVDRDAVRSGLEAFFQSQEGPQGIVLAGAIWIVRARA